MSGASAGWDACATAGLEADYMTASAPPPRVDWLLRNDHELGMKGAEHDDYKM
jgi:hypothetical protein